MASINEAFIAVMSAGGGAVLKGAWDYFKSKRQHDHERAQLESENSVEIRRAELEHHGGLSDRLLDRIDKLEDRIDGHDRYCDEKISSAIAKSEAECEANLERKLRSQAEQLRAEFKAKLEETSEPSTIEVAP